MVPKSLPRSAQPKEGPGHARGCAGLHFIEGRCELVDGNHETANLTPVRLVRHPSACSLQSMLTVLHRHKTHTHTKRLPGSSEHSRMLRRGRRRHNPSRVLDVFPPKRRHLNRPHLAANRDGPERRRVFTQDRRRSCKAQDAMRTPSRRRSQDARTLSVIARSLSHRRTSQDMPRQCRATTPSIGACARKREQPADNAKSTSCTRRVRPIGPRGSNSDAQLQNAPTRCRPRARRALG